VSRDEFAAIYDRAGRNDAATPMRDILPRAGAEALFAATLGPAVDESIRACFREGDAATGCMLDVYASGAADRLADLIAGRFREDVAQRPAAAPVVVLPYSPGYCGWDVTGQTALFARLQPEEIGVRLNANCLMQPIKSVSGVLIAGPLDTHRFRPKYPCCAPCGTHECRRRIDAARKAAAR
jgi:hypothetical protein